MKTSLLCAILISACTHSNIVKIHGIPRMTSKSQKTFEFFKTGSFLTLSVCILTMSGWYYKWTYFTRDNIEIHLVLMFFNNMFHFMFSKSTSFSWNFFGLCAKKTYNAYNMLSSYCTKSNYERVTTTKFILRAKQWTPLKKGLTFSLNGIVHNTSSMPLKHTANVTTHVN